MIQFFILLLPLKASIIALEAAEYPVKPWISLEVFVKALTLVKGCFEHWLQFQALMLAAL